jgi:mono/diheme cytochrome c family protein
MKFTVILAVIMVSVSVGYAKSAFAAGDAASGKEIYSKKCASCHGAGGEGKETVAKTLKVQMRHLGSKEVQSTSDADLKKDLLEGTRKMKPVTGVDAKSADDVVAYLRTLKK